MLKQTMNKTTKYAKCVQQLFIFVTFFLDINFDEKAGEKVSDAYDRHNIIVDILLLVDKHRMFEDWYPKQLTAVAPVK